VANAGLVADFWRSYGPTTPSGFTSVTDAAAVRQREGHATNRRDRGRPEYAHLRVHCVARADGRHRRQLPDRWLRKGGQRLYRAATGSDHGDDQDSRRFDVAGGPHDSPQSARHRALGIGQASSTHLRRLTQALPGVTVRGYHETVFTQAISIPLDPATATAYESVTDRERRQLQLLLRLRELTEQPPRPLADVLDEAARAAAARGLTGDILRDLLADD
jgi:hypothetical protein